MKRCLSCSHLFAADDWACPQCQSIPQKHGEFRAFSYKLATQNDGFNPDTFARYAAVEAGHFWFLGRNKIVRERLLKFFQQPQKILEIGCGTGFVLANTRATYPHAQLSGSDIFTQGLSFAKQRVPSADFFQMDACDIPFIEEFDLVSAFDVLEHIDDDAAALGQIFAATKTGGGVVFTVPQHAWLWSNTDDYAHHKRRYSRAELVEKVTAAGFEIRYVSSFISLLLPAMLASRLLQQKAQADDQMDAGFKIGKLANRVLGGVMTLEAWLIARGVTLPIGGSLLLIAQKTSQKEAHVG
ncbi:MAG: class I SAM-dependent methyltransferase [Gallionella sp.]